MGVLVITDDPALPGPKGAAPITTRIGLNVGWGPAHLGQKTNGLIGENLYAPTPGGRETGSGFNVRHPG